MKLLINFFIDITELSTNYFINSVSQKISQYGISLDEIIIQISSSGGSSDHGLLIYNFLKGLGIKKTTVGMSNVDSAAIMLFCAGEERFAMSSCRFLIHEPVIPLNAQFNSTKLKEISNMLKNITIDYSNVICEITSKKKSEVLKKVRNGTVLSSFDAKTFGLVNKDVKDFKIDAQNGVDTVLINNNILGINFK